MSVCASPILEPLLAPRLLSCTATSTFAKRAGNTPQVFRKTGMVTVKDVNVVTKHNKPRGPNEKGSISKMEAPIHHSNVQLVTADGVISRVHKECALRSTPLVFLHLIC